jgi:hypothetical protein
MSNERQRAPRACDSLVPMDVESRHYVPKHTDTPFHGNKVGKERSFQVKYNAIVREKIRFWALASMLVRFTKESGTHIEGYVLPPSAIGAGSPVSV